MQSEENGGEKRFGALFFGDFRKKKCALLLGTEGVYSNELSLAMFFKFLDTVLVETIGY